jgi:hypothetical protein
MQIARDELYTALSRCKSLDGLKIMGNFEFPEPFEHDHPVKMEMERLAKYCKVKFELKYLYDYDDSNYVKIIIHNIENLHPHYEIIKNDFFFQSSHVINLHETWIENDNNNYNIENFDISNKQYTMKNEKY